MISACGMYVFHPIKQISTVVMITTISYHIWMIAYGTATSSLTVYTKSRCIVYCSTYCWKILENSSNMFQLSDLAAPYWDLQTVLDGRRLKESAMCHRVEITFQNNPRFLQFILRLTATEKDWPALSTW